MQQPFSHILTILFNHQYFSNNQFKSINITYEKETSTLLRNFNIIIKSFPGGIHLLTAEPELLDLPEDTVPIRLLLNNKDSLFFNYTELPPYQISTNLLYLNNINAKFKNGNNFLLHDNDFVGQNEVVPVSNGKITIPQYDSNKKYVFTDATGQEIAPQNFRQSQPGSGDFFLSNIFDGLIHLKEGNKDVAKVFCYTNAVWRKPLGMLEIFPGMLYKHYKDKGKLEYAVNFNNRQTVWKYFLVDPVYKKFKDLTIINKTKEQVFKTPEKKTFHEDLEALVFESKNKIPFSELSNNTFQLVDGYDAKLKSGKIIIKNLANASPDLLYHEETNSSETIYSHIFI